ncbi:MAG: FecR domain-containing protein, partial [Gemmatimonadetes bacterium]|nr:FecR domain-containing protein [Gemmatimonadota bacterium]
LAVLKVIFVLAQVLVCACVGAQTAGRIEFLQGDSRLIAADGAVRAAQLNGLVQTGESIETSADAEVHVVLVDGGMLAVRGGSQIRLQTFRAQGDARDESTLQLVRGALRVVTGWVARINPRNVRYVTPNATIGVRGTDFDIIHLPTGGDAGSHTRVREGAVVMQSE